MYDFHLSAMADRLVAAGLIQPDQHAAAKAALGLEWVDKIAITWSIEDVQTVAKVSDDEASEVLAKVLQKHDAELGVNWDTLREYAGGPSDDEEQEDSDG